MITEQMGVTIFLLNVPYNEKEEAKRLGAHWSPARRKWYLPNWMDPKPFHKWLDAETLKEIKEWQANSVAQHLGERNEKFYRKMEETIKKELSDIAETLNDANQWSENSPERSALLRMTRITELLLVQLEYLFNKVQK